MIAVTLDKAQQDRAAQIGAERLASAKGRARFAYRERSGVDTHVLGAMAELAFCEAVGLTWPARVGTYRKKPDVDPFWEVRWSGNPDRVKVARDDDPYSLVAHVTGKPPKFSVWGYIVAGWVQQHVKATDLGERGWSAHFATRYDLSPIDEGFHSACAWFNHPRRGWICDHCGRTYARP